VTKMSAKKERRIEQALSHDLRRRILRFTADREDPASPKIMSQELEHPLSNVAYHVRELRRAELLEETSRLPVRGSIEHFFQVDHRAARLPQVAEVLGSA
jgi:DNA-binding transcriptional ArsR family regulator